MSQQRSPFSSHQIWLSLLPTIIGAAILPYIIYRLASPYVSITIALLLAIIPPAAMTLFDLVRTRSLNLLGILSLLGLAIHITSTLTFKDARLILISGSLMTGVYGILMLGSLLIGKPLLRVLATNMLSTVSPERREQFEKRWQAAGQGFFTILTAIWGAGLFLTLLISIVLAYTLSVQQFFAINPIVQYGTIFTLLAGTQIYGAIRHFQKNRHSQPAHQQEQPASV